MSVNDLKKRITALILTAVMTLSMSGFAFTEAFADDEASGASTPETSAEEAAGDAVTDEDADVQDDPAAVDADDETAEDIAAEDKGAADKATEIFAEPEANLGKDSALNSAGDPSLPLDPTPIEIRTAAEDGRMLVVWKAVAGAEYYMIYLDADETGTRVAATEGCSKIFENVAAGTAHSITIKAFRAKTQQEQADEGSEVDADVLLAEGTIANVKASSRNAIRINSRGGANIGINLRTLLGEAYNGYAVSQGSCTDGKYAYYLLVNSSNQKGRILKTQAGTGNVINASGVINVCHGNGMAMDTKNNRIVVVGRKEGNSDRRNELTVIDANNYQYSHVAVNYCYSGSWDKTRGNGLSAISYIEKYDCFVALQRETHEILVLDSDFKVIGQVGTTITGSYPGTYQAMDADERYVYLLLSAYQSNPSRQPHNLILVLDWNSENLLQLDPAAGRNHISTRWMCNNNGSGRPDTVVTLNTPFEAESLYHIDQGNGTSRFYLAEYHNNPQYVWKTKKKTVKVKWKKVKKRVKWKKVRVKGKKGKKKWKWKYKTKKVWKYKKKKKKVKVQVYDHLNRDNYVYHLDVM